MLPAFLLHYILTVTGIYGEDCSVTVDGTTYDMSALASHGVFEVAPPSTEVNLYMYSASFCENSATCESASGNFIRSRQLIGTTKCLAVYGQWSTAVNEKTSDGFSTTFKGPQACEQDSSVEYSSVFNYVCDRKATDINSLNMSAAQTGSNDCKFTVTIPTSIVCNGGGVAAGLSGGSIFLITLLSVAIVYLIVMFTLSYHREKTVKVPHKGFWCSKLPFWTKAGCLASWGATVTCYRWSCRKIFKVKDGDDKMEDALIRDEDESS